MLCDPGGRGAGKSESRDMGELRHVVVSAGSGSRCWEDGWSSGWVIKLVQGRGESTISGRDAADELSDMSEEHAVSGSLRWAETDRS